MFTGKDIEISGALCPAGFEQSSMCTQPKACGLHSLRPYSRSSVGIGDWRRMLRHRSAGARVLLLLQGMNTSRALQYKRKH